MSNEVYLFLYPFQDMLEQGFVNIIIKWIEHWNKENVITHINILFVVFIVAVYTVNTLCGILIVLHLYNIFSRFYKKTNDIKISSF